MNEVEQEQLKMEIAHIFESGANEIRIFEMVKSFIKNRNILKLLYNLEESIENISISNIDSDDTYREKQLAISELYKIINLIK